MKKSYLGIILLIISALIFIQVLSRYFLHQSLSFLEELNRYLFIIVILLGIFETEKTDKHMTIQIPEKLILNKIKPLTELLKKILFITFIILNIIFSTNMILLEINTGQKSAVLGIPIYFVTIFYTVSFILLFFVYIKKRRT